MISIQELQLAVLEINKENEPKGHVHINLLVKPGSKSSGLIDVHEARLRLKVKEPARDDLANKAVVKLISKVLKVSKSQILLIRGHKSKMKTVEVSLGQESAVRALFEEMNK